MNTIRLKLVLPLLLLASLSTAVQAIEPVNSKNWAGQAIRGYDPVAYFLDDKPVRGAEAYTHLWQDATWHFASEKNRDRFAADPEKWAPRYGGWCAYAMAKGYTANIDPRAFTIHDGALYLNYSLNVMKKWQKDMAGYIELADRNYPRLVAED